MRRHKKLFFFPNPHSIKWSIYLVLLQSCGNSEFFSQADLNGSYLIVDELNMAAGAINQVQLACKRGNGQPLSNIFVQVAVEKAGMAPQQLTKDWLTTNEQGQQAASFTLSEAGMYSLSLQLKRPGSNKVFTPSHAYTVVQVLEDKAIGILQDAPIYNAGAKSPQAIVRGTSLNTQLLLLDSQLQLQHQQETTISFSSSDPLAILPQAIQLTAKESGNKIILRGAQLYTLGEQSLLAIEDKTSRIVSEQRYLVTLGAKTVYRALLRKPEQPVVADGESLAQIHLTLTDGAGEVLKQMQVTLAIGQGSTIRSIAAQTDLQGMAVFSWTETTAGNKALELFLQVPSGMLPIQQDSISFVPGSPVKLQFSANPLFGIAGEILDPSPTVQAIDELGNLVMLDDVAVTIVLPSASQDTTGNLIAATSLQGTTTVLLKQGIASFPDLAILHAGNRHQLEALAPGLQPAQSHSFPIAPTQATKLVFTVQPASGLAYGVPNFIEIAIQDTFGNPVPQSGTNVHLTLDASRGGWSLIQPTLSVTSNGTARFDAALNRSGQGFFVQASADNLLPATSLPFDVAPGAPDGLFSQITVLSSGPTIADGQDAYLLNVILLDGQETPITGFPVQVSTGEGQVQVTYPFGAITDYLGVVQIMLRSTLAGEKTVLVNMGPINRLVNPKPLFSPGQPYRAGLSLSQSALILNGVSKLTITGKLEDVFGNAIPNAPYTLTSNVITDSITPSTGITDSQGKLEGTWQGVLAGQRSVLLESGGYSSLPALATFLPGPPSLLYSTLSVSPNPTIADGQDTTLLEAYIADGFNNPVPNMQILFSSSGKDNFLPNASVNTDTFGIANSSLSSLASQDKQIQAKLVAITLQAAATFLPAPCIGMPLLSLGKGKQTVTTGRNPRDVVSEDFNQDGIFDLAVVNEDDDTIGIFLALGDGTFRAQVTYETDACPNGLTTLDVNRDGIIDLAVINYCSNNLSVLLGRADGTFGAQNTYGTGNNPIALTSLDANRDGFTDLAVLNLQGTSLGIFLGLANGSFAPQVTYQTGSGPYGLTVLDANRDGIVDLAVVNAWSDTLSIFLGLANGTFAPQVSYDTGYGPKALTTLDANRDGLVDLAIINFFGGNLDIFEGLADGTFEAQASYATEPGLYDVTTLDANQDGLVDVAVVTSISNSLGIFLGLPDGRFASEVIYQTGAYPVAFTPLQANQNGIADLAVVNSRSDTLGIFFGLPNGTFEGQVTYETGSFPVDLTNLDANQDGLVDLAVVNSYNNTLGIFLGQADGTFGPQVTFETGFAPRALTTLDANRDGLVDLAVVNEDGYTLGILLGQGDGTFGAEVAYDTGVYPYALITLDINLDGLVDLAVANSGSANLGIFLGKANGTFEEQVTYATGLSPSDLTAVDANRDGLIDLAVVNWESNTLSLLLGLVNGTLAPQVTYATGFSPHAIATLDTNRDDLVDVVVLNWASNTLGIFLSQANGTFAPQVSYPSGIRPLGLKFLDINLDNIQDIFTFGSQSSLHIGLASGGFSPAVVYDQPGAGVVVDDLNKDYVPDLIMISYNNLQVIERLYCEP